VPAGRSTDPTVTYYIAKDASTLFKGDGVPACVEETTSPFAEMSRYPSGASSARTTRFADDPLYAGPVFAMSIGATSLECCIPELHPDTATSMSMTNRTTVRCFMMDTSAGINVSGSIRTLSLIDGRASPIYADATTPRPRYRGPVRRRDIPVRP
jgi:hypothetical protein